MTSRLIVQHIVLPIDEFEGTEDLYTKEGIKGFPIRLSSGDSVDLRTYFNFFPSERYRTYAGINSIKLKLECEGTPVIEIHRCDVDSDDFERLSYLEGMEIELKEECLLGLVIRAEDSDVTINGGHFYVETEKVNKIHLAHIICTYHRETEVKNKLDLICRILRNYPFIEDDYSLYVVDNGRSFQYDDDLVKVIPSDNYGGSGGFSRGMIEAINDGISTHVVLNDDDAVLDPEVIYRTISFYKLISEEKKETILGGTIFDKGHPLTIHEAGAYYDNGVLRAYDDMDPMTVEGCISADQSLKGGETDSYIAWCYVAIPCDAIRRYGMALPLFFQYDDVDFSLRVKDIPKITMCGISVWHHYLKFHSVNRTYYSARNMLTIAAVNGRFNTRLVRNIFFFIMTNIGCYRYSSAEAQLQAIYDFRKGPVKVFDAITEDYSRFEEYKFEDPVEMEDLITKVIKHCRPFYYITLNGIIFPSIGNIKADMESYETYEFYRKGKAYYFSPDGKMMVSDRSRKKIITLSVRTAVSMMALLLRKRHINKIYSKASRFYSSEENWMRLCNSGKK